jgi:predicted Fe-Mo cluster-binding NifX family protein
MPAESPRRQINQEHPEDRQMKIGITSQNFRTITGHAGKTRRFLVYSVADGGELQGPERIDLPKEMSLHEYRGSDHPVFAFDVLICAGCGEGFRRRMQSQGVEVVATAETDPQRAASLYLQGEALTPALPHEHEHGHDHGHGQSQGHAVHLMPQTLAVGIPVVTPRGEG